MKRIGLSVCVWMMLVLFIFSGCGKDVPNHDNDNLLVSIVSDEITTVPYQRFSWDTLWRDNTWIATDALQLICVLPEIAQELPIINYHNDFSVQYEEGVSFSHMMVYDDSFEYLHHIATYSKIDYLSYLKTLPEGTYYIGIAVSKQGKYIASEKQYEYHGYECVFKLVVNQ